MEIITPNNTQGYFSLVLHAHLPYIRHPEHEFYLEENWLYEAITESYIPLISTFENLLNDRIDFRITLSVSPTLIAMFEDQLLRERYTRYIDRLIALTEDEVTRTRSDIMIHSLAKMYLNKFQKIRYLYSEVYRKDLFSALRAIAETGKLELITSAATHAFLPALLQEPSSVKAQLRAGTYYFKNIAGFQASGIWLPECGFVPEIDAYLKETKISFFFLESHGVLNSKQPRASSIYAPMRTPSGVIAFARDVDSSREVWSAAAGYPGDPDYRDFYRDIGFDHDFERLREYFPHGIRTFTGLKYYRITGSAVTKMPYQPETASKKAAQHASDFFERKKDQVAALRNRLKIIPLITAAYDAELFGHWWFEGPEWLREFLALTSLDQKTLKLTTPSEYISSHPHIETGMPVMSSWGEKGYNSTWINRKNDWLYKHSAHAAKLMFDIAAKNRQASGVMKRALNQASRELLLAQASDWAFMIKTGNAAEFAAKKFIEHIENFLRLHKEITTKTIHPAFLEHIENKNNIFPDIDFRIYI